MKIVFFGTPDFAVPSLDKLNQEHEVVAVVTAPDKERGRGRKVSYTSIKEYALKQNLKILQPEKLDNETFIRELKEIQADLFIIVAFRILPRSVFELPTKGSFNLHGSLLPKYRGAAPIQWALINGDTETGVTTFFLKEKVDTGNIILQEKIEITKDDDFGKLHDKMSLVGAELVLKTVEDIENEDVELQTQNDELTSPAPKITKELGEINWNKPAKQIHNLIRGLSPFPGAYFVHNNLKYKVFKSKINESVKLSPGEIKQTKNEIFIGCSDSSLQILELQPEGRKRMLADAFLRGYSLNSNQEFMNDYLKTIKEYEQLSNKCIELSSNTSNRKVKTWREEYASHIFAKLTMHSIAITKFLPNTKLYEIPSNFKIWDLSSLAVIVRALIETYNIFYYLIIDEVDESEKEFRYIIWHLHSESERLRMLKSIGSTNSAIPEIENEIRQLKEKLLENEYYIAKTDSKQKAKLRKGEIGFDKTSTQISESAGISKNYYRAIYKDLSSHIHTFPFSIKQISVFKAGDTESLGLLKSYADTSSGYLSLSIRDFVKIFPDQESNITNEKQIIDLWEHVFENIASENDLR
ncbi:MAG: methionyl-tRNA formyltransferase [Bacteroidota bacterium]